MLLGVFALARGQHFVTKAYAQPLTSPVWEKPLTLDLDDISRRISQATTYTDAGHDVAESLAILPRLRQPLRSGQPGAVGNPTHAPDRARDPPSSSTRTESRVR